MQNESWLIKNDRIWGMMFFKDKQPNEDGTTYMRVHIANCRHKFFKGFTFNFELRGSEKLT